MGDVIGVGLRCLTMLAPSAYDYAIYCARWLLDWPPTICCGWFALAPLAATQMNGPLIPLFECAIS